MTLEIKHIIAPTTAVSQLWRQWCLAWDTWYTAVITAVQRYNSCRPPSAVCVDFKPGSVPPYEYLQYVRTGTYVGINLLADGRTFYLSPNGQVQRTRNHSSSSSSSSSQQWSTVQPRRGEIQEAESACRAHLYSMRGNPGRHPARKSHARESVVCREERGT